MGHSANKDDISGYQVPMLIFNKNNLPCANKLPNLNADKTDTSMTFDWVLESLCGK